MSEDIPVCGTCAQDPDFRMATLDSVTIVTWFEPQLPLDNLRKV